MGACQFLMVGRGPKITLEALDIHPLCNMTIDSKQGEQNEPQIIISRCEFRCITRSAMSEPSLEKHDWQGRERGEVMCVKKLPTWERIFVSAGASTRRTGERMKQKKSVSLFHR